MTVAEVAVDPFRSIRGTENSQLENQKQAIGLLKATEDAIRERQLPLTPENYFSALFPLLDDESKEGTFGGVESRIVDFNVAVCYLLSFVFPLLPEQMLVEEYTSNGRLYATFAHAMRRFHLVAPFVRCACVCVRSVLLAHAGADWQDDRESLGELFLLILGWSVDARPKVRKSAQEAVALLVSKSASAAALAAEFASAALLNATRKDPSSATHLLPLCKTLLRLPIMESSINGSGGNNASADNLVSGLLHDLTLGNTSLSCLVYGTIEQFAISEDDEDEAVVDGPTYGRVYKRLLDAMLKTTPIEVTEIAVSYCSALSALAACTIAIQVKLEKHAEAIKYLQATLSILIGRYFASAQVKEVLLAAAQASHSFCSALMMIDGSLIAETLNTAASQMAPLIPANGRALNDALIAARFTALMPVLAGLIEVIPTLANMNGNSDSDANLVVALIPLIVSAARLHDCKTVSGDTRVELVKMLSSAVKVGGFQLILEHLPLCLFNNVPGHQPRAWLIPIIRDACYNDSLSAWMTLLKPEIDAVAAKVEQFKAGEKAQEARVWEALHFQLLCVLPALLSSHPTDFHCQGEDFKNLMAQLLNDYVQLRPTLMAGLLKFCQNTMAAVQEFDANDVMFVRPVVSAEADQEALQNTWLPLLLPVLFNIYASTNASAASTGSAHDDEDAGNDLTLKLISALLSFAHPSLIEEYFGKTVSRVGRLMENAAMLGTVLDLASTMIPHASTAALQASFLSAVVVELKLLEHPDTSVQKKAYRCLQLALQREDLFSGVECHVTSLILLQTLLDSGEACSSPAKRPRFKALCLLAPSLTDESLSLLPQLLPEVMLGVKEVNHRCRAQANDLLVALGRRMSLGGRFEFGDAQMEASLQEYFRMVLAGLAGSTPHMVSAAVMALARVVFEFSEKSSSNVDCATRNPETDVDAEMAADAEPSAVAEIDAEPQEQAASTAQSSIPLDAIQSLTSDVCTLLQSPSREIVKSAISFVKVSLVLLPSALLAPLLPAMVSGLLRWATVHHQQFKLQVKHLLERLLRRFGDDVVGAATPEEHQPLLANIKKTRERRKRKKAASAEAEAEENPETAAHSHSMRARFERALNDDGSDVDDSDADADARDNDSECDVAQRTQGDAKSVVSALTRKLSLHSLRTQRVPNISRKQQLALLQQQQQQQQAMLSKKQLKRTRSADSASEDDDNGAEEDGYAVRMSTDGRLCIGTTAAAAAAGGREDAAMDLDRVYRAAMSSFTRSADGKRVKFARGTKNAAASDDDNDDSDNDNDNQDDRRSLKTAAAKTGKSTKSAKSVRSALSALSGRSALSSMSATGAHSGAQYRPGKSGARGDAKRKDAKFDPYAYVPIQRSARKAAAGRGKQDGDKYFMKRKK